MTAFKTLLAICLLSAACCVAAAEDAQTLPPDWKNFVFTTPDLGIVKDIDFNATTSNGAYVRGYSLRYAVEGAPFTYTWPSGQAEELREKVEVYVENLSDSSPAEAAARFDEALKNAEDNVSQTGWKEYWNAKFEKVVIDKDCQGAVAITAPEGVKFKEAKYKNTTIPNTSEYYVLRYKNFLIQVFGTGYRNTQDTDTAIYRWVKAYREHLAKAGTLQPDVAVVISQVIDKPAMLVSGKPALIEVTMKWDKKELPKLDTEIRWTRNGAAQKTIPFTFKRDYTALEAHKNEHMAVFGFVPDSAAQPTEKDVIEVTIKDVKDEADNPIVVKKEVSLPVDSMGGAAINVIFVPINIGTWDPKELYNDQGQRLAKRVFAPLREKQMEFMRGIYPLAPGNIRDVTQSDLLMDITPAVSEQLITGVTTMGLLSRLEDYYKDMGGKADFVVGVLPTGYLKDMGTTENAFPHVLLIDQSSPGSVVAHEIGHDLGFAHNQDAYGKGLLADKGALIRRIDPLEYEVRLPVKAKVDTVDFMDVDPKDASNTWISRDNYTKLIEAVKKRFGSYVKSN